MQAVTEDGSKLRRGKIVVHVSGTDQEYLKALVEVQNIGKENVEVKILCILEKGQLLLMFDGEHFPSKLSDLYYLEPLSQEQYISLKRGQLLVFTLLAEGSDAVVVSAIVEVTKLVSNRTDQAQVSVLVVVRAGDYTIELDKKFNALREELSEV